MTAETIKSTAQTLAAAGRDILSQSATQAAAAAKSVASEAGSALRDGAGRRAEAGIDSLAEQGERLAFSLHQASQQQEGTLQARLLETVANTILDTAESFRGQDLKTLLGQADRFARRNPGAFVASAALLGFAAVRFAKSSGETAQAPSSQPATTGMDRQP